MSENGIVKGAAAITFGTLIVQAGGALGQFVYAIWLTPADFGLWATASASIFVLNALINGGETNGYLASESVGLRGLNKRAFRFNLPLSLVALAIAAFHAANGRLELAVLVGILALEIPLQGFSALLVAAFIKERLRLRLVSAQFVATLMRLSVGSAVAAYTRSPVALGLALVAYTVTSIVALHLSAARHAQKILTDPAETVSSFKMRLDRMFHQASQTLPTQIDYLVVSLVAGPALLGLYYFSYQVTTAIAGVVVGPLSKTAMTELTKLGPDERIPVVGRLLVAVSASCSALVCLAAGIIYWADLGLPNEWAAALSPIVILLGSLGGRLVAPISESLNMVNGQWRRSTVVNIVDGLGTALAACVALHDDLLLLAIAIGAWKVVFACGRAVIALGVRSRGTWCGLVLPIAAFYSLLAITVSRSGGVPALVMATLAAICVLQFFLGRWAFASVRVN